MKTYLITGGAGFIGANFVKYMLQKYGNTVQLVVLDKLTYAGHKQTLVSELDQIEFVEGDICDATLVNELFRVHAFDYVVNFAAESHVDRSIENPQLFLQTNIAGTQNLLELARTHWSNGEDTYRSGVKFLQVSTDEVYGSLGATGFFTEETPLSPRSPYSASKASADLFVQAYIETYKFPANITRCSNNYGPYHFPEKLIPLIINNLVHGRSLPVYGDGQHVRDWLFVSDHCKAIDLVLERGSCGEVYNVGGHNERTNLQIVTTIIATIQRLLHDQPQYEAVLRTEVANIGEHLITYVTDRKGHDRRYAIDPSKITAHLGWAPETTFEAGIVQTVQWYFDNRTWVDSVLERTTP